MYNYISVHINNPHATCNVKNMHHLKTYNHLYPCVGNYTVYVGP